MPDVPGPSLPGVTSERFTLSGPDGASASINELRAGYKQGFVFELVDHAENPYQALGVVVLVVNPDSYTLTEPFMLNLTPAEDDSVVEEANGIIVREVRLEGTFGLRDKTARGFMGVQGGGAALSGSEHFNALRNLFRQYSARKKDPATSATTKLIFHALRTDDHFVVSPRQFEMPRDSGTNRVHLRYRITLAAIDEADRSKLVPLPDTSGFSFTDALRDINEAFNDARAAIAEVTANIAQIKRKVANIQAVIGNAVQVVNAVGGFLAGTTSLINFPLQLAATVTDQVARAGDRLINEVGNTAFAAASLGGILAENSRSMRRLESAIDRISMYDEKFQDQVDRVEDLFDGEKKTTTSDTSDVESGSTEDASAPGPGGATIGTRTRVVAGSSGRTAGLEVPRGTGFRTVRVSATDSLESIAFAARTTTEAIIVINELRAPYITDSGGPGLLKPGDTVLVPVAAGGDPTTGRGVADFLTAEEALYGIDIALDPALLKERLFDIRVNEAQESDDFEVVGGVRNVVQGTQITINTEAGSTVFLPDIGIRRNVGTPGTIQHVLLASITLREAILSDPRISGIQSARVALDKDVLTQEITPVLVGSRKSATFALPFGRASGGGG